MNDSEMLDFLEDHKQYVIGFAPSGDFSAFNMKTNYTCYGKTIRECIETLKVMDTDLEQKGLS